VAHRDSSDDWRLLIIISALAKGSHKRVGGVLTVMGLPSLALTLTIYVLTLLGRAAGIK